MGMRIAVGGKGGVGKTTLAALIVRKLLAAGNTPILAVDADPNTNLPEAVGLPLKATVGSILAQFIDDKASLSPGMTKESYLQLKMHEAVSEGRGVDLVAMGRGEGPGCYCYPNLILRKFVEELSANYPYVVIDNEAGMEHLSRRTSDRIDRMILVSDATLRGIRSVRRIRGLIDELKLDVGRISLVIMRADSSLPTVVRDEVQVCGIPLAGTVPLDLRVQDFDLTMRPLTELPADSPSVMALDAIFEVLAIPG